MDARCRVELLGRLRVTQGEREITRFRTQKTGALLGYLAYYLQSAHPREVLLEVVWPGEAPAVGRNSLSVALSSLRYQLEPPGVARGAVIRADRLSVRLNPDTVVTDAAEFEAAQRSAAEAGSDTERAELLAQAVELYGGELLPGYYQDWIIAEQRRLAELYFRTVRWLTAYLEHAGEWEEALDCARRGVGADPLREEAHQELIRLLAASGQPAEALHQYQELERILREELNTAPSAATQELARQIGLRAQERTAVRLPELRPAPVSPLPTGTVTFLLTDIERAKPLQEQGGPGARALEETTELLRKAFREHGGQEVRQATGVFTVAFAHPSEALSCAVECQRALAQQSWPAQVGPLRVRMALHTREVKPREDESPGWLLRLGTQLLLAAPSGQILCSEPSAALLRRSLPADVELTDLGYYRLRGLEGAERLFVVTYPGMEPKAFPPPNASPAYTSNLPIQLTAFFGREEELARLEELLVDEERRLVTLTGPGGSGKTRLALEVAGRLSEAYRDAVWSAELQALSQAGFILLAVLGALRLPRLPQVEPMEQVVTALSRQRSLLVLDNFEHLVEEGAQVVHDLLERVPTLTCLVTSRRLLEATGEREFFVGPLPVPSGDESPEGLVRWASVQLFVDRAQAARPDFQVTAGNATSVAKLCYGLEGIPLALELAAARAQVMSPAQMVSELEHRFDFLVSRKRDVDRRHRTLRAALDWSYQLLSPELQHFFAQLSVFRGGWTAEAAQEVCSEPRAVEYLEELRASSLVLTEGSPEDVGGMRFRMLETLREYAREQLPPEQRASVQKGHAEYYLALTEEAAAKGGGPDAKLWLDRQEIEHDNLREGLAWCMLAEGDIDTGLELVAALRSFWHTRGHWREGLARATEMLAQEGASARTAARAQALLTAGHLADELVDLARARRMHQESLDIFRELGHQRGIAAALFRLGRVAKNHEGDYTTARALFEEGLAIAREIGDEGLTAWLLCELGLLARREGDHAAALSLLEEAVRVVRRSGHRPLTAEIVMFLGQELGRQGDLGRAGALFRETLSIAREIGDRWLTGDVLWRLAELAEKQGDEASAQTFLEESKAIFRELLGDVEQKRKDADPYAWLLR